MKAFKTIHPLLTVLILFSSQFIFAQVSDISYTVSPAAEYIWWDDKAGLDDGFLLGGKLGIGFGEYLELRGLYMQSIDLKTSFNDFGLVNYSDSLFTSRDVDLSRWGGELKVNLSRGRFLPFLTLGTGVQSIKLDTFAAHRRVYASVGAGIVFSVGDRYTFTLEGKNTPYNFNAGKNLLTAEDKATFDATDDDFGVNQLKNNWSVNASLQFYLGGRRPGELSELDKAYSSAFSGGLSGLRVPLEPTLAHIDWDDKLPYRDTWLGGGYIGLDFGPYIGVRGFYLQSMENNKINLDFDKLAMYGGELRTELNVARGLTPYLILGGGYLNVGDNYVPKDTLAIAESQAFAMGGLGVSLPLSRNFKLYGGARAVLTSGTNVEDLQTTDQVNASWMYSFGINLTLGKKAEKPIAVFQSEMDAVLEAQKTQNEVNRKKLKEKFETRIVELEKELNEAYDKQDTEKAAALLKEKEMVEEGLADVKDPESPQPAAQQSPQIIQPAVTLVPSDSRIQLTPAEFENLIEEILENVAPRGQQISPAVEQQLLGQQNTQQLLRQQELDRRMVEIEKLLIQMNEKQASRQAIDEVEQSASEQSIKRDLTAFSAQLLLEIQKLSEKIEQNNKEIQSLKKKGSNQGEETEVEGGPDVENEPSKSMENLSSVTENNVLGVKTGGEFIKDTGISSKFTYEGMSGFAGVNLGGQLTFNTGLRWYYGIAATKFELMPEAFFGFGSPSAFGLTVNGILPIPIKRTPVTPYLGAGTGFMQIAEAGEDKLRLNYNFIFGTYLNVLGGRLYADFTARNLFRFNQVIAGYRFSF